MWRLITSRAVFALLLLSITEAGAQTDNPYHLNGSAYKENCNCYTLTPDALNQSGSVWNINKISLDQSFDFKFNIYLGCKDAGGADGIAFVLQPISTSVGTIGGGMGYEGITPSIGVIVDTWQNVEDNDPAVDHIAIQKNGVIDHLPGEDVAPPVSALVSGADIEDCKWHTLRIIWNAATKLLDTEFDGVQRAHATIDMVSDIFNDDPMVFWGFTSATGGSSNHQRVCTSLNPGFYFPPDQKTCFPATVQFIDSSHSFGTIEKWFWDFGDGTIYDGPNPPAHDYTAAGNYDVKLSILGNNGCVSDTFTRSIVMGTKPFAKFGTMPLQICKGMPVILADSSYVEFGTISKWLWKTGGQEFTEQHPPPVVIDVLNNTVQLSVETSEGCVSDIVTGSVDILTLPCPEFYIPSAFSPNNDGKNDRFRFIAAGMLAATIKIFNRYGQQVYSSNDLQAGWDGRLNGALQPAGTYVWVISGTDMSGAKYFRKGTVVLVR